LEARDLVPVANSRIILHRTAFHSRNIMVARREGTGEYEVSALLGWDNAVAVSVEMAFSMLSFLWEKQDEGRASGLSSQARQKSKRVERSEELRSFFEDEIVKLIPDFLDVVKSSTRAMKLGWVAAYGLHSSPMGLLLTDS
jgi:hypothetical protein